MREGERVDTCVLTHAAHQNCDLQLRGVYVFVFVDVCMCVCGVEGGGGAGGYMCAYVFVRLCA